MNPFDQLGRSDWSKDFGLLTKLTDASEPGKGEYYQREKGDYKLYDFLSYVDAPLKPVVTAHFGLPADTIDFTKWVYNQVAYLDPPTTGRKKATDNMDVMPYADLYPIFQRHATLPAGNVQVYRDGRITDGQGNELQPKRR